METLMVDPSAHERRDQRRVSGGMVAALLIAATIIYAIGFIFAFNHLPFGGGNPQASNPSISSESGKGTPAVIPDEPKR